MADLQTTLILPGGIQVRTAEPINTVKQHAEWIPIVGEDGVEDGYVKAANVLAIRRYTQEPSWRSALAGELRGGGQPEDRVESDDRRVGVSGSPIVADLES